MPTPIAGKKRLRWGFRIPGLGVGEEHDREKKVQEVEKETTMG